MKNFNLEELERKQIYSVKDSIFEEVQARVLAKTTQLEQDSPKELRPKGRVIPLRVTWGYMAAALVVLLGLGIVLRTNLPEKSPTIENLVASNPSVKQSASQEQVTATQVSTPTDLERSERPPVDIAMNSQSKASARLEPKLKVTKPSSRIMPRTTRSAAINQLGMEQIITSLTSADIAELSRDAEMDIYLDLY